MRDADSLEAMVGALPTPRVVWVMVPAGDPTHDTVKALGDLLTRATSSSTAGTPAGPTTRSTPSCSPSKGIGFVDCGVSGGVWGLENGYALMAGGDADDIDKAQPIFDALRPEGDFGWVHAGRSAPATSPRWSTTASSTP